MLPNAMFPPNFLGPPMEKAVFPQRSNAHGPSLAGRRTNTAPSHTLDNWIFCLDDIKQKIGLTFLVITKVYSFINMITNISFNINRLQCFFSMFS